MYIEPARCAICGKQGRPGDEGFTCIGYIYDLVIQCACSNKFKINDARDQMMLSPNVFVRLNAASNYVFRGATQITVGRSATIQFDKQIDIPCKAVVTVSVSGSNPGFVYAKELYLAKDRMEILTSASEPRPLGPEQITVSYIVYGLIDVSRMETWYALFYSAITNLQNGLFKAALMDYATSFEAFLENYLRVRLTAKYDSTVADYLLERSWKTEERCKSLLFVATGHRLSERVDVYQAWDNDVRKPRNQLAHGEVIAVDQITTEKAHQATYQAIRWIENLA